MNCKSSYVEWLTDIINHDNKAEKYTKLISHLYNSPFKWSVANDDNRELDGIALRDYFAYDKNVEIGTDLDGPCSMFEMMVALARRCEDDIMTGTSDENRTYLWFWDMISNSGLSKFDDEKYNFDKVEDIIGIINDRKYKNDGTGGGLFVTKNDKNDFKNVELWYQLSFYLQEKYYDFDEK